jgi:hypothetical protein
MNKVFEVEHRPGIDNDPFSLNQDEISVALKGIRGIIGPYPIHMFRDFYRIIVCFGFHAILT